MFYWRPERYGVCKLDGLTLTRTAFRKDHPDEGAKPYSEEDPRNPERHIYSRYTQEVSSRAEHVLSKITVSLVLRFGGMFDGLEYIERLCTNLCVGSSRHFCCECCHSRLRDFKANLMDTFKAWAHYRPKRIAVREGYHGCHASIAVYKKIRPDVEVIDLDAEYKPGDLCWLETPVNPYGESRLVTTQWISILDVLNLGSSCN